MTHDELLAKIDGELITHGQRGNVVKHSFALRAVVQLHKPVEAEYFDNPVCAACSPDIDTWFDYPCQTIQAIEKELL